MLHDILNTTTIYLNSWFLISLDRIHPQHCYHILVQLLTFIFYLFAEEMFVTALVGLLVSTALAEITKGTSRRLFEPIFRKLKYYVVITGHFWIVEFYVVAGGSDSVLFDRIHNGIVLVLYLVF